MRPFSRDVFYLFLGLVACFLYFEISYFFLAHRVFLTETRYISEQIHFPPVLYFYLFRFFLAQLLVHLLYALILWLIYSLLAGAFNFVLRHASISVFTLWLFSMVCILNFNQIFFPYSKFALLTDSFFPNYIDHSIFSVAFVFAVLLFGWCAFRIVNKTWPELVKPTLLMLILTTGAMVFLYGLISFSFKVSHKKQLASNPYPNIILIGIDSLRPDFLSYFHGAVHTPFLDRQLNDSVIFQNTATPLARTFPSWVSILTGEYPFHHGVRFNLANQDGLDFSDTLPQRLKELGYRTVFATDETRFSNIGKAFGFQEIYTPPEGVPDFLLGSFNDFPLSNLIINTKLGRYLFPESYGNRPVYFTYEPSSFIHLVSPIFEKADSRPFFLAIHFCLPHFPYLWTRSLPGDADPLMKYQASLSGVDQQLQAFFSQLQKSHYLDHAIVIFLSDHGEALELPGDRITERSLYRGLHDRDKPEIFYPANLDHEDFNQSAGHGTDVLGLSQYRVLFAIKSFGQKIKILPSAIDDPASLLDIKATIFNYLKIQPKRPLDGINLGLWIFESGNMDFPKRHLFFESDYSPAAIRSVYPHVEEAIAEGIRFFQIQSGSLKLIVRPNMARMVMSSKQYAVQSGDWMLAIYPHEEFKEVCYWPVLVNMKTGEWTDRPHSALGVQGNLLKLESLLTAVYFPELKNLPKNCF